MITLLVGKYPYHHTKDMLQLSLWLRENKIVFTAPEKRQFLVCLQFCVNFLRIYVIEVNSWAVRSKRVKTFRGKLIIC